MTLTIPVPLPPSANALFRNAGKKLVRTAAYNAWLDEAGYHARLAARSAGGLPAAPLRLSIFAGLRGRTRDLSNCVKPIEDMLVKSIDGLPDDRWNDDVRIRRDATVPTGTALIIVEHLEPD